MSKDREKVELLGGKFDGLQTEVRRGCQLLKIPTVGEFGWDQVRYRRDDSGRMVFETTDRLTKAEAEAMYEKYGG